MNFGFLTSWHHKTVNQCFVVFAWKNLKNLFLVWLTELFILFYFFSSQISIFSIYIFIKQYGKDQIILMFNDRFHGCWIRKAGAMLQERAAISTEQLYLYSLPMRFCGIVLQFGTDEWPTALQNLWCSVFN